MWGSVSPQLQVAQVYCALPPLIPPCPPTQFLLEFHNIFGKERKKLPEAQRTQYHWVRILSDYKLRYKFGYQLEPLAWILTLATKNYFFEWFTSARKLAKVYLPKCIFYKCILVSIFL